MIETLTCQSCGEPFHRRRRRGPKPARCIDCEMARPAWKPTSPVVTPRRTREIPRRWARYGS